MGNKEAKPNVVVKEKEQGICSTKIKYRNDTKPF